VLSWQDLPITNELLNGTVIVKKIETADGLPLRFRELIGIIPNSSQDTQGLSPCIRNEGQYHDPSLSLHLIMQQQTRAESQSETWQHLATRSGARRLQGRPA
jgi:hypothetical protein